MKEKAAVHFRTAGGSHYCGAPLKEDMSCCTNKRADVTCELCIASVGPARA